MSRLRRAIGPQNAQRMRLEGHDHRLAAEAASALGHVPHHFLVRPMYAVEVAHTDHGGSEVAGYVVEMAEDLHT